MDIYQHIARLQNLLNSYAFSPVEREKLREEIAQMRSLLAPKKYAYAVY